MVSIDQTAKKYRGRKAETYDAVRERQRRWALENAAVARMLGNPASVLDCPVGTGRFLALYRERGVREVVGIDSSEAMLALARAKVRPVRGHTVRLEVGDARAHPSMDKESIDAAVCVRFLDLIDEEAMRAVVTEMTRVARNRIILTIRLGENYVPKVNTAEHDRKKFHALVRRLGWRVEDCEKIFDAGWEVLGLKRRGR